MLGLKVNISKSLLVGIGYSEETTRVLANIIRCKSKCLPIIYLGLPIGVNSRSKSLWDLVVENFERKLSSWKRQYLSLDRRITMIKACLSNLTFYYMFLLRMLKAMIKRLDRIQRDFLWEGQGNKNKLHLSK